MNSRSKKLSMVVVALVISSMLGVAIYAQNQITISLGKIMVTNMPAFLRLQTVSLNGVACTIGNVPTNDSATCADSSMYTGVANSFVFSVKNVGGTEGTVSPSPVVTTNSGVISLTYASTTTAGGAHSSGNWGGSDNPNPSMIMPSGSSFHMTYTVTAVAPGNTTPSILISWS